MMRYACYIEEYNTNRGLSARLREKNTNRIVSIEIRTIDEKQHFLNFLSQAKINQFIMPTIFERAGTDIVAVYGIATQETDTTIYIDIVTDGGGYRFE